MGELILPALRFRRVGTPFLYLNWARLSLFSTVLKGGMLGTDLIGTDEDTYGSTITQATNVGLQLDIRLVLFSYMRSTLSIGYATAQSSLKDGTTHSYAPETMISLQILD